jgi:D-alanine-D-alanine ligase
MDYYLYTWKKAERMKVMVLMGGISLERDVSLVSGTAIDKALRQNDHDVINVDTAKFDNQLEQTYIPTSADIKTAPPDMAQLARYDRELNLKLAGLKELYSVDAVFLAFHGGAGEDGTIQALLDLADIKYTGSGMLSSAMAMNKAVSKKLFERDMIPTPEWILIRKKDFCNDLFESAAESFPPPVIVKPNDQGSTVGLTLVESQEEFKNAIERAFDVSGEVLIEKFIDGRELTVAILDDRPLPVVEIIPKNKLYDYEAKYTIGMCSYECPANIPDDITLEIRELALRAFRCLNCRGYARIDFRMDQDNKLYCLEVNTLPGMTETSLVPKAAKAAGITFEELIEKILKLADKD